MSKEKSPKARLQGNANKSNSTIVQGSRRIASDQLCSLRVMLAI